MRALLWTGFTAGGTALNMWASTALLLFFAPSNLWGYLGVAFGALLAGGLGGAITGFGQVLALRKWLNVPASLGSFFSTILASSLALAAGTVCGWWMTAVGALPGALAGILLYGVVFGLLQRPMLEYLSRRSLLWVLANSAAAVLGVLFMLAVFDLSGSKREMLQFRYCAVAYALVVGVSLVLMTRETRKDIENNLAATRTDASVSSFDGVDGTDSLEQGSAKAAYKVEGTYIVQSGAALFEVRERHSYEVFPISHKDDSAGAVGPASIPLPPRQDGAASRGSKAEQADVPTDAPTDAQDGVIDATYRVLS
jgi:hypothetical protein